MPPPDLSLRRAPLVYLFVVIVTVVFALIFVLLHI
jgi:hypothetical protein